MSEREALRVKEIRDEFQDRAQAVGDHVAINEVATALVRSEADLDKAREEAEKWKKVAESVERGWDGMQAELQRANGALETMRRQMVEKNAAIDLAEAQLSKAKAALREEADRFWKRANGLYTNRVSKQELQASAVRIETVLRELNP